MNDKITVTANTSPRGGGAVRVYIGDTLAWIKRVATLNDLLKTERAVKETILLTSKAKQDIIKTLRLV